MIPPRKNLSKLRRDRDEALARTIAGFGSAKARMKDVDTDIAAFAKDRPMAAICGAVAMGAATGLLLSGRPVMQLAKAAGLVVLGPLVGDLVERMMRLASGEAIPDEKPSDAA